VVPARSLEEELARLRQERDEASAAHLAQMQQAKDDAASALTLLAQVPKPAQLQLWCCVRLTNLSRCVAGRLQKFAAAQEHHFEQHRAAMEKMQALFLAHTKVR
jgi:hypothetical protein